jgi:hypothetical protein
VILRLLISVSPDGRTVVDRVRLPGRMRVITLGNAITAAAMSFVARVTAARRSRDARHRLTLR